MSSTKFHPVLVDNAESKSILSNNDIRITEEVSAKERTMNSTRYNSLSATNVTFSATDINDWIDSNIELVWDLEFVFTGATKRPTTTANATTHPTGTAPFLFNAMNNSVVPLVINKIIQRAQFNLNNKQWSESDRQNPEMIDIIACQYDKECLNSYGIELLSANTNLNFNNRVGSLLYSKDDIMQNSSFPAVTGPYSTIMGNNGFLLNTQNMNTMNNFPWKQNNKGYVDVKNVFTYSTGGGDILLGSTKAWLGFEGIDVPTSGGSIFYSMDQVNGVLKQVVTLTVHEFLSSPSFGNKYSHLKTNKAYYTGGYSFGMSFDINTDFLNNQSLVWYPNNNQIDATAFALAPATKISSKVADAYMRFYTFKQAKPLPNATNKVLYYFQQPQTPVQDLIAFLQGVPQTVNTLSVSTSNLSSMPPYLIVYCGIRANNTNHATLYQTNGSNMAQMLMCDLQGLTIQYGTQADAAARMDREHLVQHTLDVLGNPEFREYLQTSKHDTYVTGDLGTILAPTNNALVAQTNTWLQSLASYAEGFSFYIIDFNKLNLRDTNGIPILSSVNYGSTNYKNLSITATYKLPDCLVDASSQPPLNQWRTELNVVLMEKHIRTIPIGSIGNLTDDKVEYNLNDFVPAYNQYLAQGLHGDGDSQVNYVGGEAQHYGGSFLGNLVSSVKKHLPSAVAAVRGVERLTRGNEKMSGVHDIADNISKAAQSFGLGSSRSKYSRA